MIWHYDSHEFPWDNLPPVSLGSSRPRFTAQDAEIERRIVELALVPGEFQRLQRKLDHIFRQWNACIEGRH